MEWSERARSLARLLDFALTAISHAQHIHWAAEAIECVTHTYTQKDRAEERTLWAASKLLLERPTGWLTH